MTKHEFRIPPLPPEPSRPWLKPGYVPPGARPPPPTPFEMRDMRSYAEQYGEWMAEACAQFIEHSPDIPREAAAKLAEQIRAAFQKEEEPTPGKQQPAATR